jgi:hypothetical protein
LNLNPDVFTDALVSLSGPFLDRLPTLALSQLVPDRSTVSRAFAVCGRLHRACLADGYRLPKRQPESSLNELRSY